MEIDNSITLIDDDSSILDLIEIHLDDFELFKIGSFEELEGYLKENQRLHLFSYLISSLSGMTLKKLSLK